MEGFTFAYNIFCGGTFTEESGIIHSPMYPNPYQISRVCTYDIVQPPGNRIMLSLLDVNIETIQQIKCSFDYLEIFDGDSENSTKLASFCNDDSEEDKTFFYSTNNYMLLKFSTDVNFQGRGFMANYTTINTRAYPPNNPDHTTPQSFSHDAVFVPIPHFFFIRIFNISRSRASARSQVFFVF